jgi:tetratricopeptide (TPR) repeat protein
MLRLSRQPAAISGVRRTVIAAVACALLCTGVAGPAHAQAGRLAVAQAQAAVEARHTTMARALFEEGLRNVDAGQWAQAEDRFERVLELRYSAVAAYNLGLAQAKLGHGVVAAATLRKLLADATLEPKVRERASALLAEVEAHFGWLTLRVLGKCDGCSVYLNREEWPWAAVGVSVPIDPGKYKLELRWADVLLAQDRLEVSPAARVEASLAARPGALKAAQEAQAHAPQPAERTEPLSQAQLGISGTRNRTTLLSSPWFWSAMGVLVVGAVAAIALERH